MLARLRGAIPAQLGSERSTSHRAIMVKARLRGGPASETALQQLTRMMERQNVVRQSTMVVEKQALLEGPASWTLWRPKKSRPEA